MILDYVILILVILMILLAFVLAVMIVRSIHRIAKGVILIFEELRCAREGVSSLQTIGNHLDRIDGTLRAVGEAVNRIYTNPESVQIKHLGHLICAGGEEATYIRKALGNIEIKVGQIESKVKQLPIQDRSRLVP